MPDLTASVISCDVFSCSLNASSGQKCAPTYGYDIRLTKIGRVCWLVMSCINRLIFLFSDIEHVPFLSIKFANLFNWSTEFVYITILLVYKWQINIHFSCLFVSYSIIFLVVCSRWKRILQVSFEVLLK